MLLNLVLECQVKAPNSFDKFVDMKYNNSEEYEVLKTRYKATKSYTFYKKYLNKRMPKTIDDLMSIMKNSNQYDSFKREYETIKTIKRKDWNKKYKKEIIEIYNKPINYIE